MEGALKLWAVIFAVGALNYVSRVSFIALFSKHAMPPLLARALRYVPAAMLSALVLPMVVDGGSAGTSLLDAKIIAAAAATVVAYWKLGTLWTLGVGMASLWLLNLYL